MLRSWPSETLPGSRRGGVSFSARAFAEPSRMLSCWRRPDGCVAPSQRPAKAPPDRPRRTRGAFSLPSSTYVNEARSGLRENARSGPILGGPRPSSRRLAGHFPPVSRNSPPETGGPSLGTRRCSYSLTSASPSYVPGDIFALDIPLSIPTLNKCGTGEFSGRRRCGTCSRRTRLRACTRNGCGRSRADAGCSTSPRGAGARGGAMSSACSRSPRATRPRCRRG